MRAPKPKGIPEFVKASTRARIVEHVRKNKANAFRAVEVRFHGKRCYIDAVPSSDPEGAEAVHLCRLDYLGSPDRWAFAFYTYAGERYEPSVLMSGDHIGTPEEAVDTSTLFY